VVVEAETGSDLEEIPDLVDRSSQAEVGRKAYHGTQDQVVQTHQEVARNLYQTGLVVDNSRQMFVVEGSQEEGKGTLRDAEGALEGDLAETRSAISVVSSIRQK